MGAKRTAYRPVVTGMLALVVAFATACGSADTDDAAAGSGDGTSTPGATTATTPDGPAGDAITVHGDWDIRVLEPDGTVARTVEFPNALTEHGANTLSVLFARRSRLAGWEIHLFGDIFMGQPCRTPGGGHRSCVAAEPDLSVDGLDGEFFLSGSTTVDADTEISRVTTMVSRCDWHESDESCLSGGWKTRSFTSKQASDDPDDEFEPIPVTAGQVVQVSVTISFS